jgi:hypothetical protein
MQGQFHREERRAYQTLRVAEKRVSVGRIARRANVLAALGEIRTSACLGASRIGCALKRIGRREFLAEAGLLAGAAQLRRSARAAWASTADSGQKGSRLDFATDDAHYLETYARALDLLARNVCVLAGDSPPVLTEGSSYRGIWLESAPQEGLVYSLIRPDVARNNQLAFFALQRDDGQLPGWIRSAAPGFSQIQMVVPIAATARELSQQTGDTELLEKAYQASSLWDAWLRRYRDTRHTGLCEGFCTYDTGEDNSPRWAGIPNRCPDGDARKCPPLASLPRLCPDLSATVYGGRVALADMALALGKNAERDQWLERAHAIRSAILTKLFSPEDAAFYDVDAQNHFVRIRGSAISRVLGEHVVDARLFDAIWRKQIHDSSAFWAPFPLPSIALNDPAFVRPIRRNSWGGPSQALTALRAPRWMEHYGKPADLAHLMQKWVFAILRDGEFLQQLDPLNGRFTPDTPGYSPAALCFVDFTWRLSGVRPVGERLEWNVRPAAFATKAGFRLRLSPTRLVELRYSSGAAELLVGNRSICRTRSTVRLITSLDGTLQHAVGISASNAKVRLSFAPGAQSEFFLEPNEKLSLTPRVQNGKPT